MCALDENLSYGFIRDTLEIELLILYILNRLPGPVDKDTLSELTICDGGVNYFSFSEALADLVSTGHVEEEDGLYVTTDKGRRNGGTTESSVPYSVRMKAERAMIPVVKRLRRNELVRASTEPRPRGGYTVKLSLADKSGPMMKLELLVGSQPEAETVEKNFRAGAEELYLSLVRQLTGEE